MEFTDCIGAIDQGTQSTRVFFFDKDCNVLGSHQTELPQIYPQAGWVEHDPLEIWRTVQECLGRAWDLAQRRAATDGRPPLRLLSIGLTNQRETTVVWSRSTGMPLHNAIVWLDTRTSELCEHMVERLGGPDALRAATGLPISPYFSATKYLWMYENVLEVRDAVDRGDAAMGTVDSWLVWCLTGGARGGVHVTDVTNASRTLLMDLETCDWYEPALQAFCCPRHVLPTIVSNSEVYGTLSTAAATVIGRGAAGADEPPEPPPLGGMPSGGYGITIDGPFATPQITTFGSGTHANGGVGLPPPVVPSFSSSPVANGGPGVGLPHPAPPPQPSAFCSGLPPPAVPSFSSSAHVNGCASAGLPPLLPPAVPSLGSSAVANGGPGVGLPPPAPPPMLSAFGSGLPPPALPSLGSGAVSTGGAAAGLPPLPPPAVPSFGSGAISAGGAAAGLPPLPPPTMPSFGSGAVGGVGVTGASVGPAAQLPNFGSGILPNGGSVAAPHVPQATGGYRRIGSVAVMGPLIAAFEGVPIAGCLGDQMAAMLGQRCRPGEAKNTYGTGCFMLLNTGQRRIKSTHGLLTTVAFRLGKDMPTFYALEGSVAVAGLGISWLRDNLQLISSAAESEWLAETVKDSGGVYFVPAFSGLLAPRWRPDARGVLLGMTSFTTRGHIVRAMLEAICFQSREVLDAMRRDAELDEHHGGLAALRVDGGAAANDLLMQLQADILQVPVIRPAFRETTSLGAALAAGMAVGLWSREELFAQHPDAITVFGPAISQEAAAVRYARWNKAVERSLDLADLTTDPGA